MARNGQHKSKSIPSLRTSSNHSHPDSDWVAAACSISFGLHKYPLIIGSCSSCWALTPLHHFTTIHVFASQTCFSQTSAFEPNGGHSITMYYALNVQYVHWVWLVLTWRGDLRLVGHTPTLWILTTQIINYDVPVAANSKAPYFQTNPHCWNWHCPGEIYQGKCSPSSVLCLRPRMMLRKRCVGLERVWLSHGRSCFLYRSLWLLQS